MRRLFNSRQIKTTLSRPNCVFVLRPSVSNVRPTHLGTMYPCVSCAMRDYVFSSISSKQLFIRADSTVKPAIVVYLPKKTIYSTTMVGRFRQVLLYNPGQGVTKGSTRQNSRFQTAAQLHITNAWNNNFQSGMEYISDYATDIIFISGKLHQIVKFHGESFCITNMFDIST